MSIHRPQERQVERAHQSLYNRFLWLSALHSHTFRDMPGSPSQLHASPTPSGSESLLTLGCVDSCCFLYPAPMQPHGDIQNKFFFFPLTHVGASQIVQQLSRPTLTFCFFRINICLPPDHFLGTQFPLASWLLPSDHMPICPPLWRGLSIENRVRPHIPPNRPHFW